MYPKTTEIHFIQSGEVRLKALFSPKPAAESVLLLHGGPGTPDPMPEVAGLLSANYQVIYFDQRGSGQSVCENNCAITIEAFVSDIAEVLNFFKIEKAHFFGHSWGGVLTQVFALQHPERVQSMFLCSSGAGTGMQWRQMEMEMFFFGLARTMPYEWPMLNIQLIRSRFGSDNGAQHFFQSFHDIAHRGFPAHAPTLEEMQAIKAETVNQIRNSILAHASLPAVMEVSFPVTITYSDHDTDIFKMSRHHVLQRFLDAQKITIPEAGHFPWLHNPPEFARALAQHFRLPEAVATGTGTITR